MISFITINFAKSEYMFPPLLRGAYFSNFKLCDTDLELVNHLLPNFSRVSKLSAPTSHSSIQFI
jgi:hypothetical protein